MTMRQENVATAETPAKPDVAAAAPPSTAPDPQSSNHHPPVSILNPRSILWPGVATGGLPWLCHFPVGWSWLAWVALIPLLSLVRRPAPKLWIFLSSWVAGFVFFGAALRWMPVADDRMYVTWISLAFYCSFYYPLAIGLIRLL